MKKFATTILFACAFVFFGTALWLPASGQDGRAATGQALSVDERVAYQQKVEAVYWQHRVWQNPQAKPALEEVLPATAIRARVEDVLRKSNALQTHWRRPITAKELQAEVERMARQTRDPELLRELFAALNNDAFLIAEILARPNLAETLAHDAYVAEKRTLTESSVTEAASAEKSGDDFEAWWQERRESFDTAFSESAQAFPLPQIATGVDDLWSPMVAPPIGGADATAVWTGVEMIVWNGSTFGTRYNPALDMTFPVSRTNAPPTRNRYTAVWTGREMIIWGGYAGSAPYDAYRAGWKYSPTTDSWAPTSAVNAPEARTDHVTVWTGNEMIVWGGWDPVANNLTTGGRYNPTNDTWTPTTQANAPQGRLRATAVWTGQEMIVWGGTTSNVGAQNTGGRYNPQTDSWTATSTANAPAARFNHTAVWTGSEMIIWGGNSSSAIFGDGARYNPSSDSWTPTSPAGLEARRLHTAVWTGSEMIVWGGCIDFQCSISRETGSRYNPASDSWTATAQIVGNNRSRHAAVWTGTEMLVAGGCRGGECQIRVTNIIRYDPAANAWRDAQAVPIATPRQPHRAVWTGAEMLVWGVDAQLFDTSVYRFNPAMNRWVRSVVAGAPDARFDASAVWSGTELIIWGGDVQGLGLTRTGGRYNPMTDSWTATSITNAPSARSYHEAVWTGAEMIVWGGGNGGASLPTSGGRYNPANDTWTPMSTAGAPSGRLFHTVVWTGQEMIVWGGSDATASSNFATGGRYNPSTNTWTATSTANAPSARNSHTAVWTGSEMIVWGGTANGAIFNSGARYNPVSDTWTATSVANAPSPRWIHSAIWTGREMIVWGGLVNAAFPYQSTNTGGRYDPASETWRATSLVRVPDRRSGHTAVWTGSQMLIWGGSRDPESIYANTGAVYNVQTDSGPIPTRIVSRKFHGAAGAFDIDLPLDGTAGGECRNGGINSEHQVVFTFPSAVTLARAELNPQPGRAGALTGGPTISADGREVTLNLSGVTNAQTVAVTLYGVTNSAATNDVSVNISFLLGDTTGNGAVTASDVGQAKAQSGQPLSGSNFRSDVNVSGTINASDIGQVKAQSGTMLP